eukprot:3673451-Pyramimonas_sp.AAC.1
MSRLRASDSRKCEKARIRKRPFKNLRFWPLEALSEGLLSLFGASWGLVGFLEPSSGTLEHSWRQQCDEYSVICEGVWPRGLEHGINHDGLWLRGRENGVIYK